MAKPLTREQSIIQKLRKPNYQSRELRIEQVQAGIEPYAAHLTIEEILEILPGHRISWVGNVAGLTPQTDRPLWFVVDVIVSASKRLDYDPETRVLTFQCREWQTRAVRMDRVFDISHRIIPDRDTPTERTKRRPQMTKRA